MTKKKVKPLLDSRGLVGNTGVTSFGHINTAYSCNDGVLVLDPKATFPTWLRLTKKQAAKRKLEPINCRFCAKPATRMGHMWPWESMGTTCDSEECRDKDRRGDE